jgi:hypothetical protein
MKAIQDIQQRLNNRAKLRLAEDVSNALANLRTMNSTHSCAIGKLQLTGVAAEFSLWQIIEDIDTHLNKALQVKYQEVESANFLERVSSIEDYLQQDQSVQ